MNSSEHKQRTAAWLRVYAHEITRRKTICNEKPKAARKLFSSNPKGLIDCCEEKHVYVPATILWIHDGAKGGYKIDGFKRRGFHEAKPFKVNGYLIIPQMCWNCVQTREDMRQIITWTDRQKSLAIQIANEANGRRRGREGRDIMLDDWEDLFDDMTEL